MTALALGEKAIVDNPGQDHLNIYTTCNGIDGNKSLLLKARIPKTISAQGENAVRIALIMMALAGLLSVLLIRNFLQSLLFRPLERLTKQIQGINRTEDLSVRLSYNRKDEIGILGSSFDTMLEELENDSKEKKTLFDKIEQISKQDGLTGLANRSAFDTAFDKVWRKAIRSSTPLALILLDVDHFKQYNDFYGHVQGDFVLQQIGVTLKENMQRAYDLPARYGGEEFVALLPEIGGDHATRFAETLRSSIESLQIPHEKFETSPFVTASLGVGAIVPIEKDNPIGFLATIDKALYKAKTKGRNRVVPVTTNEVAEKEE